MHNLTLPLSTRQESMSTRGRSGSMSWGRLESMSTRGRQDNTEHCRCWTATHHVSHEDAGSVHPQHRKVAFTDRHSADVREPARPAQDWVPTSYEGTQELDKRRKLVLRDGRTSHPLTRFCALTSCDKRFYSPCYSHQLHGSCPAHTWHRPSARAPATSMPSLRTLIAAPLKELTFL